MPAVCVLITKNVVKGKGRIGGGRGEKLKESAVAPVFRVAVPTAVGITRTAPRLQHRHRRLPSRLAHESSGMLCFISPRTILHSSPQEEVELASMLGVVNVSIVQPIGRNLDFPMIRRPNRLRTVIRFQHQRAMIDITHRKNAQLSRILSAADRPTVGPGVDVHVQLVHSFDLEYSRRGPRTEEGKVILSRIQRTLDSIESSLGRAKPEFRHQAVPSSSLTHYRHHPLSPLH